MQYFYLFLIAFFGGILGGMGMGGGTLLIPLLSLFLGFNQRYCQGLNLIAFIPMCVIVLFIHKKNKLLEVKVSFPVIIFGIIFCIISSIIAQNVNNNTLKIAFGFFLIILSIFQILKILIFKKNTKRGY